MTSVFRKIVKTNSRKVFCLASSTFSRSRTKFIRSVRWQRLLEGTKHTIVGEKLTERERFSGNLQQRRKIVRKVMNCVSRCGASFFLGSAQLSGEFLKNKLSAKPLTRLFAQWIKKSAEIVIVVRGIE